MKILSLAFVRVEVRSDFLKSWSDSELERYSRQIILPDIGIEGQQKICKAKVLVIGAGGLGSPVLLYLAAAGVGELEIVDNDVVENSNLQRQILHFQNSVGLNKSISAKKTLKLYNPKTKVKANPNKLDIKNALKIMQPYDFIVDCTDNFDTKLLINDICYSLQKPYNISGAIHYQGQCLTVNPLNNKSACYRCLFPKIPKENETCSTAGILGTVVGIIGLFQATEVLKYLSGQEKELLHSLLCFNAKTMEIQKIYYSKNKNCTICMNQNNES